VAAPVLRTESLPGHGHRDVLQNPFDRESRPEYRSELCRDQSVECRPLSNHHLNVDFLDEPPERFCQFTARTMHVVQPWFLS
jgi:hypothetical protein